MGRGNQTVTCAGGVSAWRVGHTKGNGAGKKKKEEKRGVNIEDPKSAPAKALQRKEAAREALGRETLIARSVALEL